MVTAPGHRPLTTHIFVGDSPYIESDAVFGPNGPWFVPPGLIRICPGSVGNRN